jgi:prepilin-type N-terminal cleavage/methylation domain-containing protein
MLKYRIFRKPLKPGQMGFTLIELLIVIAILGMLAGIVVPNVSGFLTTGNLGAATTELQNVKTAALAYKAQNNVWPGDTNDLTAFVSGSLHATYTFDSTSGFVTGASGVSWAGITWSPPPGSPPYICDGEWIKN